MCQAWHGCRRLQALVIQSHQLSITEADREEGLRKWLQEVQPKFRVVDSLKKKT